MASVEKRENHPVTKPSGDVQDLRFRSLLGQVQWSALPVDTQRRFSKRVAGHTAIVYTGNVTRMEINLAGRWLANILRLIGAPLPLCEEVGGPSVVCVTEDLAEGGQLWTRVYSNNRHFPQVINSAKRFSGPTGLEEYVGFGITMALRVSVQEGVLVFDSAGYYLGFGAARLRLPGFVTPGQLTVTHADCGDGYFDFGLVLRHRLFGQLLKQIGRYREG